ncbi:MAG: glycosyltransferase family 87 protein [Pseudomonadota bacterium]
MTISHVYLGDDLAAYVMAGHIFAEGRFDAIYPSVEAARELAPPDYWSNSANLLGRDKPALSPFIYPPLWAAVMGALHPVTTYGALKVIFSGLVTTALIFTAEFTRRLVAPEVSPLASIWSAGVFIPCTTIGVITLNELQAQAFVAVFTVGAFAFSASRRPAIAGTLLALAASLKLFPALFVLFWIARGSWKEAAYFTAVGATLGCLSIAAGGWDMTYTFLLVTSELSSISVTVVTSLGLTPVLSILEHPDVLQAAFNGTGNPLSALRNTAPLWVSLFTKGILIVGLGVLVWLSRHATRFDFHTQILPTALFLVPLTLPLAWTHSYAWALFFPVLLYISTSDRFYGYLTLVLFAGTNTLWITGDIFSFDEKHIMVPVIGTVSVIGIATALFSRTVKSMA